jgi:hypothetical protein
MTNAWNMSLPNYTFSQFIFKFQLIFVLITVAGRSQDWNIFNRSNTGISSTDCPRVHFVDLCEVMFSSVFLLKQSWEKMKSREGTRLRKWDRNQSISNPIKELYGWIQLSNICMVTYSPFVRWEVNQIGPTGEPHCSFINRIFSTGAKLTFRIKYISREREKKRFTPSILQKIISR